MIVVFVENRGKDRFAEEVVRQHHILAPKRVDSNLLHFLLIASRVARRDVIQQQALRSALLPEGTCHGNRGVSVLDHFLLRDALAGERGDGRFVHEDVTVLQQRLHAPRIARVAQNRHSLGHISRCAAKRWILGIYMCSVGQHNDLVAIQPFEHVRLRDSQLPPLPSLLFVQRTDPFCVQLLTRWGRIYIAKALHTVMERSRPHTPYRRLHMTEDMKLIPKRDSNSRLLRAREDEL